jgi:hypothetical protein
MHESNVNPEDIERRAEEQAPVEEAGGGESEGFEQAEKELIENAEGDLAGGDPIADAFPPEATDPEEHTIHGEADDARSHVVENPNP